MKKFLIKTLGCKVNQYDSAKLKGLLLSRAWLYSLSNPDYLILNTCAVTKKAISKNRQLWQSLKKKYPRAKLIIFGCWPQVYDSAEFKEADLVAGVGNLEALAKQLETGKLKTNILQPINRVRYFLKIADGCNQFCSYCIIRLSRGPLISRPMAEIIEEAKMAEKAGYQEIVLTAINLGAYGKDFSSKNINLYKLLKEVLKVTKEVRFRLSSIELNHVNTNLINLIANSKGRICQHLHIPLQSASDKILKLMKRPYSSSYYKTKLEKIRSLMPKIALTSDIIVAFPQESEADFQATYNLARQLAFSKIHVFPFSEHQLCEAAKLKGQLEEKTKKQRSAILRKLSDEMAGLYRAKMLTALKEIDLLIEKKEKDIFRGKSEFYFDLKFKWKKPKSNKIKVGQLIKLNIKEIIIVD